MVFWRVFILIVLLGAAVIAGLRYSLGMTKKRQTILYSMLYVLIAAQIVMYLWSFLPVSIESIILRVVVFPLALISISALFTWFVCVVTKKCKDPRKVLFRTALVILCALNLWLFTEMIFGISQNRETYFPAHICRQLAFFFLPVAYLAPKSPVRDTVLRFTCYASIAGAILTLTSPLFQMIFLFEYLTMETVVLHSILLIAPIMIFACGEAKERLYDIPIGAVLFGVMLFAAFLCNYAVYLQTEAWGNYAYLTARMVSWIPVWLYMVLEYLFAVLVLFTIKAVRKITCPR